VGRVALATAEIGRPFATPAMMRIEIDP
jgi:hypothetical protein